MLPQLSGGPICISSKAKLAANRGKLLFAYFEYGTPVYAASFIRRREIVLERDLFAAGRTLRLIVVHEVFHFVWARLSNRARREFADLLLYEIGHRARGELGESAGVKKNLLTAPEQSYNARLWRDYVCESFCDTAAWFYSGVKHHKSFTLANRWRKRRQAWFQAAVGSCCNC